ncbi:MAG TPA: TSUP family transporter, partial [Niastella sp.]|nr:TSUP family transporter [Niastella sp.]
MTLFLLCVFAFLAGFTDAIAGGGGLIQTPAALVLLPQIPLATVLGTLKIPSFSGTSIATLQYIRRVSV